MVETAAATPFLWGAGGAQMTPERIAAERKLADALLTRGMDYSPVQSWTQGVSRVAQAMMGGYDSRRADQAETANAAADKDWLKGLAPSAATPAAPVAPVVSAPPAAPTVLGAGGIPAVADAQGVYGADAVMMPPGAPSAPATPGTPDYGKAIAGIESGGRYDALGPTTRTGDRAYGKYQVMGANVPAWTKAHLGQEMTPQQFLANPQAQDAVFKGQFGQYVQQTGNPQDAASMWFTGKPLAEGANRRDVLGTTGRSYVDMFTKKLGPTAAPAPTVAAVPEDPAALPPNATPTQGFAIPGQPAPAAPAVSPGVAAVAGGMPTIPLPALLAKVNDPYASEGVKKIAGMLLQHQMQADGVTTVDLGNAIGVMDKRGNLVRQLPKGEPNKGPTYGVIDEDAFGNKKHGWINPRDQSVTPYKSPDAAPAAAMPAGPDGKPLTPPPGADPKVPPFIGPDGKPIWMPLGSNPKEFQKRITDLNADAAGGKMTEVQAKSEKFGNRMELAQKNVDGIDDQGQSLSGRAKESLPWNTGNIVQAPEYRKYKQARDSFVLAMLRDESGAAIGTPEFIKLEREMFPQPGDDANDIKQKREARRIATEAMKKAAGPGYKSPTFDTPPATKTPGGGAPDPLGIR